MDVFAVLADPTRRAVLDLLADGERTAGDLAQAAPALTQPAVSRHLRVLRDAGLVRVRVDGQRRVYRLDPAPLTEVDAWVDRYRPRWTSALGRLATHLSTEDPA
ncbi:helix-turn-helix transcriptional regulator [Klenkia sp. PcliD-1-E]|uniref:ArsR/SmtB family transcription factor n=1 Tax=Klenkia sp. PcliD-1-E TaxID=2954492 RepID=UPI002097C612|nr:metalloregulator ArsR/SmtB family transcription factor [Klenkia sp. PcliD-1-E]MCO7220934.1 metalloregulator ArsR/SmtB family transcription factor [Klenkia sp. PcliD-1-E]